jgi:ELWxxDGT repeat protein
MGRIVRSAVFLLSAFLAAALPSAAGTAELLLDINREPAGAGSTAIYAPLAPVGDRVVFRAYEPSSGAELWGSDGTPLGTRLLRDVAPGGESTDLRWLGSAGRTAMFLRDLDFGLGPFDLWRSDGTAAGTFRIAGLTELKSCSFQSDTPESVVLGNRLFFLAGEESVDCGLWRTDGTTAGTHLVEDLGEPAVHLVTAGSRVFFFTEDSGGLWVSNGDSAGLVRSFEPFQGDGPRRLTAFGSRVVFLAREGQEEGEELWISDGTVAGTRALTHFFDPDPFGFQPLLKAIGNILYFTADDGTGIDLWLSEGGGTPRRVTDFIPRAPFGESLGDGQLARLGNLLIFSAQEDSLPRRFLWLSGGTPETTRRLDGCAGGCPEASLGTLETIGNRVVFGARNSRGQVQPWGTDGTGAGTQRLADVSLIDTPVLLSGRMFFAGVDSGGAYGVWKTDGTAAGTVRLANLGRNPFSGGFSEGFSPVAAGGRIFFPTRSEDNEPQLWVSDGSTGGTRVIALLRSFSSSSPFAFTPFSGGALFGAREGNEINLWRTDGTAGGTSRVKSGILPVSIVPAGGTAFVLSSNSSFDRFKIWRTDGTETGTSEIVPAGGRVLRELAPFGGGAVFAVEREDHRISLWQSDSTPAGAHSFAVLPDGITTVQALQSLASRLYFFAYQEGVDRLWTSDGTAAGTRPVGSEDGFNLSTKPRFVPFGDSAYFADSFNLWKTDGTSVTAVWSTDWEEGRPTDLIAFHGALFFMAGLPDDPEKAGLWRTDGTPAGTFLVRDVGVPANRSLIADPVRMVSLGDRLLFPAGDGEHGIEPWASDGTTAGTVLVRDIAPGEDSALSESSPLTVAGGKVYFSATDGTSGFELWESDGTAAGTRRVQDIAPGALSSEPDDITVAGSRLLFAADDGLHGEEPWILSLVGGGCVPSTLALCLGGRFRVEAVWRDFQGAEGAGVAVPLTADTGTFWFFNAANVEVIVKVLDGRGVNGHQWVFYGALSNVEYMLTVTDTVTGAVRRYYNPLGWLGSLGDTEAFGPRGAAVSGVVSDAPIAPAGEVQGIARLTTTATCVPGAEQLCLQSGRFAVKARWRRANGMTGTAKAVPLPGGDTGYLWFFDADNVEVVVKVLDGRPFNNKFWVFFGALSDVEYTLTVTDTQTGVEKTYTNPSGRLASVADTGAF